MTSEATLVEIPQGVCPTHYNVASTSSPNISEGTALALDDGRELSSGNLSPNAVLTALRPFAGISVAEYDQSENPASHPVYEKGSRVIYEVKLAGDCAIGDEAYISGANGFGSLTALEATVSEAKLSKYKAGTFLDAGSNNEIVELLLD